MQRSNDENFVRRLREKGLVMIPTESDGNCLFRAVAHQMYGDQSFHDIVRDACMNWIVKERNYYSQYVDEDFDAYVIRKRRDRVYGNDIEIQAISELYGRRVDVYDVDEFAVNPDAQPSPSNTLRGHYEGTPIRLSYHDKIHYNSIIDPSDPRIGEGLLPGFKSKEEVERDLIRRVKADTDRGCTEDQIYEMTQRESETDILTEQIVQSLVKQTRPAYSEHDFYDPDYDEDLQKAITNSMRGI
eukprot:CAMPEP_0201488564 /NCGR_PEP_ID=MMETSP0151_2-20130828/18975_1 /ASSEMBLY_ACC=CAM_ASM_000257 /TAXON_ID=200890 /ORGANISM="Paramoeba atlantica, Strain 621/1 / CCAP 1560/9" /LENGTH=242 /DNA_ID=CAMNT_0047873881 /DNA_START=87 /DNA_END=815 /DNA_ORIENTATION=+